MSDKASDFPNLHGFDFIRCIGRGGMATVWEARQRDSDRIVAVKILNDDISSRPEDVEAFYAEAKTAGLLDHENIVTVFEVGCQAGRYYYVMELAKGYDTGKWLSRKGKLEEEDVLTVAESVAIALEYAERRIGMIHCDIKPANIMVDSDGTVRITDMGIARFVKGDDSCDFISGTPSYMSPEQATGEAQLDLRADIYSLGATIYHLLSGRALFAGRPDEEIFEAQCNEQVPDVRELNPSVSAPCAVMLAKFLAKDREDRPRRWEEAIADISAVLAAHTDPNAVIPAGLMHFAGISTMRLCGGEDVEYRIEDSEEESSAVEPEKKQKCDYGSGSWVFWLVVGLLAVVAFIGGFYLAAR